jgi:hypothetical protein
MQALNAQYEFGCETNFLCQAAMERSERQARPGGQFFDSIAALERQARSARSAGRYSFEKVGNDVESARERPWLAQLLHE